MSYGSHPREETLKIFQEHSAFWVFDKPFVLFPDRMELVPRGWSLQISLSSLSSALCVLSVLFSFSSLEQFVRPQGPY